MKTKTFNKKDYNTTQKHPQTITKDLEKHTGKEEVLSCGRNFGKQMKAGIRDRQGTTGCHSEYYVCKWRKS